MATKIHTLSAAETEVRAVAPIDERISNQLGGDGGPAPGENAAGRTPPWGKWVAAAGGVLLLAIAGAVFFPRTMASKRAQMVSPAMGQRADSYATAKDSAQALDALNGPASGPMAVAPPGAAPRASSAFGSAGAMKSKAIVAAAQGPMIARSVSLVIVAKDFAASRGALDGILTRHNGYAASLTVNTPADAAGSIQASLRIPAAELGAAMAELKALGRVATETQSGEEVTQQHADLAARLANSREEEQRLRAILEQRTGKIEDVLQVEEEIASVRGEIESMEAQQKTLEHRVDFVSVDLQLAQEFREQLGRQGAAPSPSTQIGNAFVSGLRSAAASLLGLVLFLEEFGPSLLLWAAILGLPAYFAWRRLRRTRSAA